MGELKPRPYQEEAAQIILSEWDEGRLNVLITWATGLGKTFEMSYVGTQLRARPGFGRILMLAHRKELLTQCRDKWLKVAPDETVGIYQGNTRETWANVICASVQSCYPDKHRRHPCTACQKKPSPDPFCGTCDGQGRAGEPGCKKCQKKRVKPDKDCALCQGEGGEEYLSRKGRIHELPLDEIDAVFIDEVHHIFIDSNYMQVLEAIRSVNPKCRLFGVTATPFRSDKKGLGFAFDRSAHTLSIKSGIDMGYLVPLKGVRVELEVDLSTVKVSKKSGDFIEGDLGQVMNTPSARKQVIESWLKHAGPGTEGGGEHGRLTAAFCPTRDSAKALYEDLNEAGIKAAWISGDSSVFPSKERARILAQLGKGEIQILVNVGVLTEGWDEPGVSCILLVRPTKSKGLLIQMVGRGTRLLGPPMDGTDDLKIESSRHNGKHNCLVIDCTGATSLGLASVADLTTDKAKDLDPNAPARECEQGELSFPDQPESIVVTGFCSYVFDVFSGTVHWQKINGARIAGLEAGSSIVIFETGGLFTVMRAGLRSGVEFICRDQPESVAMEEAEIYALDNGDPSYLKPKEGLSRVRATSKQKNFLNKLIGWHNTELGTMPIQYSEVQGLSMVRIGAWISYLSARLAFARRFANGRTR